MKGKALILVLAIASAVLAYSFLSEGIAKKALGSESLTLSHKILDIGPRPPGSDGLRKVQALLIRELEEKGWSVKRQSFTRQTRIGEIEFVNLRARFGPEDEVWKRPVKGLLCAHLDSKFFEDRVFLGADDAASACAAVVEIGKFLAAQKPKQARAIELVLFDGEEAFAEDMTVTDGLYGSRHYANYWRGREDMPEFGILLDMIGHKNLRIRIPSDSPPKLAKLMFEVAKKNQTQSFFGTAPGPILDDHVPLNLIGIPTIDIIGDFQRKSWWHQETDNAAILSAESLGISISVTLGMLDELLK